MFNLYSVIIDVSQATSVGWLGCMVCSAAAGNAGSAAGNDVIFD